MNGLAANNVSYRYKKNALDVVKNVSCQFERGLIYAIVGGSGSGKSTFLSLLAGLDEPRDGTVSLDGENIKDMDLDQYRREKIAMVFQNFQLIPLLTVLENVVYVMEIQGEKKKEAQKRAEELLLSVGIEKEKQRRYPSHLSGGEQQRVAIARALASGAHIILADEPTGNLDRANGEKIMDIFEELAHKRGYGIVIVTHDMELAARADRVYHMRDGVLE